LVVAWLEERTVRQFGKARFILLVYFTAFLFFDKARAPLVECPHSAYKVEEWKGIIKGNIPIIITQVWLSGMHLCVE